MRSVACFVHGKGVVGGGGGRHRRRLAAASKCSIVRLRTGQQELMSLYKRVGVVTGTAVGGGRLWNCTFDANMFLQLAKAAALLCMGDHILALWLTAFDTHDGVRMGRHRRWRWPNP